MSAPESTFYVTGGTLRYDAPSYVERQADKDLFGALLKGEFCYVLTSRQMGKSSLMVRSANRLREQGINVIALDLTAIGQNLTPEQWYDGLIVRMGRQLRLEDELEDFWRDQGRLSPVQRLFAAIRDVALAKRAGPLVIFVDEIDTVRSLPFSTDECFAGIRECYNRRTEDPEFNRLTFCLLGVATPSDLIRDARTTPFNIGQRIELSDFSVGEAKGLAQGLERGETIAQVLLERIIYWTNGHPYLTQRLCQAVAKETSAQTPGEVDQLCETLFLSNRARERDDNLLFVRERILRSETDVASLLDLYRRVRNGKRAADDETNPLVSFLRLSGITRVAHGHLQVRNRIYHHVFDRAWVMANMPNQEILRQRAAFRKGLLRAGLFVTFLLVAGIALFLNTEGWREKRHSQRVIKNMIEAYHKSASYQDKTALKVESLMSGMKVTMESSGSFYLVKPNKLRMTASTSFAPITDTEIICDGKTLWIYRPLLKEYRVQPAPRSFANLAKSELADKGSLGSTLLYDMLLAEDPRSVFARRVKNIRLSGSELLAGKPTYILTWDDEGDRFMDESSKASDSKMTVARIPVKAWVSKQDALIRQLAVDPSKALEAAIKQAPNDSASRSFMPSRIVSTETHQDISLNQPMRDGLFVFVPPPDAKQVETFSPFAGAPPTAAPQSKAVTDTERETCTRNLNTIYEAIQSFRKQHKDIPNYLSDLVPQFISDTNILVCPVNKRTGRLQNYGLTDPKVFTSYVYEFCSTKVPQGIWGGMNRTMKEWKSKQVELAGSAVPMVRCHLHRPVLNLAYSGKIYESPETWETMLTNAVVRYDDLSPARLFAK